MIATVLFAHALQDFLRLRRLLAWALVVLGVAAAAWVWSGLMADMRPDDVYARLSAILTFRVLPLAAAVFATAVVGQEVEQKTIVYLLTRPVGRPTLLLSRSAAAVVVVYAIAAACAFVVALASGLPQAQLGALGRDLVALLVGSLAYVGLFVAASLLINRAMVVCLLYAFGWETSVGNMPGDLYHLAVSSYLSALGSKPAPASGNPMLDLMTGRLGLNLITEGRAWTVLLILIAVCFAFSARWFQTHEYVPREDAE
ncbi:MAG: ABC transporter permease [Fimbriimonadales bacterium]|nr:ABC transporter permease [Fimbriimonadales bacterium]